MLVDLLRQIRENPDIFRDACLKKRIAVDIDRILVLEKDRRGFLGELEFLRSEQNQISKNRGFSQDDLEKAKALKGRSRQIEEDLKKTEEELSGLLLQVPNLPHSDVPVGKDESENVIFKKVGEIPKFDFPIQDYLTIAEKLDWIDVKTAAKVSGSRFGYLKNEAALLEFALARFVFSVLTSREKLREIIDKNNLKVSDKPFVPVVPPVMIKPEVFSNMARLSEEDKDERYYLPKDDLYLIGSAEHTLGAMHADEILEENNLPIRYVGFSTCFRREAGSYGKDTKGILRVHQFDKLEMEGFSLPENSKEEQDFFVAIQEYLMSSLGIPYQVMMVCTGDMGKPDARHIDIESWMPSQNCYRETHSADLMTDYQSRRLNIRIKRDNKTEFVHMNDATAFAVGRTLIALIENFQQADGSVKIPEILKKYM